MGTKIQLTAEEKYRLLREISYRLRDTLDLREILDHLLDTVNQVLPYDAAGIFVLNRDILRTPYHRGRAQIAGIAQRGFDQHSDELDPMLMEGKGIIGTVIRTGESLVIPNVSLDPRYIAGRTATRSEIAVPIIRDKRPFGALNLESDRVNAFDEKDIEVLQFVADAASISIEKSILHTEILEKRRIDDQLQIAADLQARLLMTSFRALLIPTAREGTSPTALMGRMNALLPEFARKRDFITALYGILDFDTGTFTYANCGQNFPFVVRADGRIERLTQGGPSLIIMPDTKYTTGTAILQEGDLLVLYTDGVVEVFNGAQQEFGNERLEKVASHARGRSAGEVLQEIVAATRVFSGPAIMHDDSTLVVVKRERL